VCEALLAVSFLRKQLTYLPLFTVIRQQGVCAGYAAAFLRVNFYPEITEETQAVLEIACNTLCTYFEKEQIFTVYVQVQNFNGMHASHTIPPTVACLMLTALEKASNFCAGYRLGLTCQGQR